MILCDVNVLVDAHREDSPAHATIKPWFENELSSDRAFGYTDLALSGFMRIVTHPRIFDPPTPIIQACVFADYLRQLPNAVRIEPGPNHWDIFTRLCRETGAKGNLVPDAWFAALAIESGCEWITSDRDYARFPKLKWRNPAE